MALAVLVMTVLLVRGDAFMAPPFGVGIIGRGVGGRVPSAKGMGAPTKSPMSAKKEKTTTKDRPSWKLEAAKQPFTTTIKRPFFGILTAEYLDVKFETKFENIEKKFENIEKKFDELDLKFLFAALVPAGIMFSSEALKIYRIYAESQAFAQKADLLLELTESVFR